MIRRVLVVATAVTLWLVLAAAWLTWAAIVALTVKRRRTRRRLTPRPPRFGRLLAWLPGPTPDVAEPRRMSSSMKNRRLAQLVHRDGLWCQECDRELRLDVHHSEPEHPEVHHLIAWSRCHNEPWADALWNLCLLCEPCNRGIGAGTTWRLRRFARELRTQAA